jgi:hypothetical protein
VRFARREWPALGEACVAALLVVALTQLHVGGAADVEYLFWSVCGAALLALCLGAALRHGLAWHRTRDPAAADSLFLVAWLCAPLVGSVLFPPFQAVRHLVPALPPLVLLAFRALGDPARWQAPARAGLAVLLALQLGLTATVALADAEYANAYRALAERARAEWVQPGRRVWFVGHWGWMHYARRAGLVQLHAEGPFPEPGDLLVWPRHVDVGVPVHERRDAIVGRLVPVEEILVPGRVPLRTMSPYGAGFHMLQARRPGALPSLPYRWLPEAPLERVEIWAAPRPVPRPP